MRQSMVVDGRGTSPAANPNTTTRNGEILVGADEDRPDPTRITIRVTRFAPKPDRPARQRRNPFSTPSPAMARRRVRGRRWIQDYVLETDPGRTLLDCLLDIKRSQDPTLAFRYSCGHGMCGSDGVLVNGEATLLCTATVAASVRHETGGPEATASSGFRRTGQARIPEETGGDHLADSAQGQKNPTTETAGTGRHALIEIAPLPGFTVLKDLIVDTDTMYRQIRQYTPYLNHAGQDGRKVSGGGDVDPSGQVESSPDGTPVGTGPEADVEGEYLQTPDQLRAYETLSNCITCGLCEASCPIYAGGEAFAGPAAMIAAARFINDSRDGSRQERLDAIDQADGILACQSVRACTRPCPRGIDVGEEMWRLVEAVNR